MRYSVARQRLCLGFREARLGDQTLDDGLLLEERGRRRLVGRCCPAYYVQESQPRQAGAHPRLTCPMQTGIHLLAQHSPQLQVPETGL